MMMECALNQTGTVHFNHFHIALQVANSNRTSRNGTISFESFLETEFLLCTTFPLNQHHRKNVVHMLMLLLFSSFTSQ